MSQVNLNGYSLRPIEEKDLEWIRKLRNDESTWSQLGTFKFIYEVTQKNWFKDLKKRDDSEYLVFCNSKSNLGLVRLTEIDRGNRSMCVGGDIILEKRGKGLSKIMYRLIFKVGFDLLGMNRLWLNVLETNKKAIYIYKKNGFRGEGILREAIYRNGKFYNYFLMSILAKEYYQDNQNK
ncbi:hypothetical protein A2164_01015 [Candidatus Curtissbacteria bacterium RBG_13_35_7]|uniref:N-acetyltransferase domain-containing protein n=1 Tax=Candidatus Curtissbacteria bacterium RBG_13_35_7 TaxID=1797705 RepID=A0A1F5G4X2_9BACT|nr:MAG: hypothetical protein A2164_01015 [Candidatus Curtissbacteria bacterium RBG_13_35_7]